MALRYADAKNEYVKDNNLRESDIQVLREWLEKQPHLPEISELRLIQFLQSCYFSVEMTKATIDNFYTAKTHFPEVFSNRNVNYPPFRDLISIAVFSVLSKKTHEGDTVMFVKFISGDTSKYSLAEQLKSFDMNMMLWLMQNGTAQGLHIITDMEQVHIGHMAKLSIIIMKKFMFYLQEAMPIRLKAMHFINVVPFMDKILAMMKPFMKKELMDAIYIHGDSIESMYKYIPKECLPKEFGGSEDSITVLQEKMIKSLTDNSDFFKDDEQQVVDETKRPGKPKNAGDIFGVEGTFKKLDID